MRPHHRETVCGGVRLCCARGRSDVVRNRASSSLSRDCRCTRACQASGPCAHTIETVCGGVRLCCARGRSDAVRNRASSSLSRDCRGGVLQQCRLGCSLSCDTDMHRHSRLIMLPCVASRPLPCNACSPVSALRSKQQSSVRGHLVQQPLQLCQALCCIGLRPILANCEVTLLPDRDASAALRDRCICRCSVRSVWCRGVSALHLPLPFVRSTASQDSLMRFLRLSAHFSTKG